MNNQFSGCRFDPVYEGVNLITVYTSDRCSHFLRCSRRCSFNQDMQTLHSFLICSSLDTLLAKPFAIRSQVTSTKKFKTVGKKEEIACCKTFFFLPRYFLPYHRTSRSLQISSLSFANTLRFVRVQNVT